MIILPFPRNFLYLLKQNAQTTQKVHLHFKNCLFGASLSSFPGLTRQTGIWRGSYWWWETTCPPFCILLREICSGKSFLWMAIWLIKWSWASLCLNTHWFQGSVWGQNSLSLAGDGGVSRWQPLLLLSEPREAVPSACEHFRLCVCVCGALKDLILISSPTLRDYVTLCRKM